MHEVVISIGANCGDRNGEVSAALHWIDSVLKDVRKSAVYETPCAGDGLRPYFNAVVSGRFEGTSEELESRLKSYEVMVGRDNDCREKGDVPADLDIVIFDGQIRKPWDFKQKFFRIGYDEITG